MGFLLVSCLKCYSADVHLLLYNVMLSLWQL